MIVWEEEQQVFLSDVSAEIATGAPNWSFYVTVRSPSAITTSVKVIVRWTELTELKLIHTSGSDKHSTRYKSCHQQNSLHEHMD